MMPIAIRIAPWCKRACLAVSLLLGAPAHAGTACAEQPLTVENFTRAMALAEKAQAALDTSGAQVALIARAGQDLSKYGLRFSHMGYVVRRGGAWVVLHELTDCGTAQSSLFDEGLGRYFLDGMVRWDSRIVLPSPPVQARLAAMLGSSAPLRLHEARYNMLAFPFSTSYQNSNQWVLETWAAAMAEEAPAGRPEAQAWLRYAGYRPITVEVDAMTRLGARLTRANVAFDDQPFERRMAGHIDTVTVDSVVRFVRMRDGRSNVVDVGL
jgi:hypothetical protein